MHSFSDLGLEARIADALTGMGFAEPTPVQRTAVPLIAAGRDLFMQSETGTGKTLAYLAPAFSRALADLRATGGGIPGALAAAAADFSRGPALLVLSPTQELAVQVAHQAQRLADAAGLSWNMITVLGGSPVSRQVTALGKRAAVVIGTPGRVADLVKIGAIRTANLRTLVLDEADRLFAPETEDTVMSIASKVPGECARVLASATLTERTRRLAMPFMRDPQSARIGSEGVLAERIEHWAFYVDHRKRIDFVRRLDAAIRPARCLVFASRSDRVAWATERLQQEGLPADSVMASQDKEHRRVALERFAQGKLRYLVTSDLGARGLDIAGITHIVSLDLPDEAPVYIHRAGRTGRAGASGISIVLTDGVELKRASRIAVAEGFVFRCKFLEAGELLEPTPEEFFGRAERAEAEKEKHRARRAAERGTGARAARPGASDPRDARPGATRDARPRGGRPLQHGD